MLSIAEEYLRQLNPDARLVVYGQELNPESYAICKADMLIKGQDVSNIVFGNTLSNDAHAGKTFDYVLANPPFGVEWKKVEKEVRDEYEKKGHHGRFGPGLPRISDGSLLFLLHLLSKMRRPSGRRQPDRDRAERFAALHRRRRLRRVGHPQVDDRERLAGGHRRAADRHVLQHRHRHLRLDSDQPQAPGAARARSSSSTAPSSSRRCARASAPSARSWVRPTSSGS